MLPIVTCSSPAGITATTPARPAIRPSFELASTSSRSFRTTAGTSADLEIAYVFCSTSATNTSGNRNVSSENRIINSCTTMRAAATSCTMKRRPPRTRSMTGPMNGATTRNGAKLTSRKASTLLRAPFGSTSKKNESASATTIAASPPIIAACVIASCWNFDLAPAATSGW